MRSVCVVLCARACVVCDVNARAVCVSSVLGSGGT